MTIGTKSVLFGAHCFFLHPFFVAWAWWKLYGIPWDPRLWVAFFVHDLGYIGKPNMDGKEGEEHPLLGALIMCALFDARQGEVLQLIPDTPYWLGKWGKFALLHSRYYAKRLKMQPSRLCIADKLAIALTPPWLYLPMARATGEIREYMAHAVHLAAGNEAFSAEERKAVTSGQEYDWYTGVQAYMRRWVDEHKDGRQDSWTSSEGRRATIGSDGVWR